MTNNSQMKKLSDFKTDEDAIFWLVNLGVLTQHDRIRSTWAYRNGLLERGRPAPDYVLAVKEGNRPWVKIRKLTHEGDGV